MKNIFTEAWKDAVDEAEKELHMHGEVAPHELRTIGLFLICTGWLILLSDPGLIASIACVLIGVLGLLSVCLSTAIRKSKTEDKT